MTARANSFDLLRLLAAVAVIWHHSWVFAGQAPPRLFSMDFGALGVGVFFVISGYLVTGSFQRSAGLGQYLVKRLLRILPGLVVSLAVTALLIGAWATHLPAEDYLQAPDTWLYIVRNGLLYPVTYGLPGVFEANPTPQVNPSLWTLRFEFTLYLLVAALGVAGLLRAKVATALALVAAAVTAILTLVRPDLSGAGWGRVALVGAQFGFLFLAGAVLRLRGRPPPAWSLALAVLLVTPLWALGLPALVVRLGEMKAPRLPADLSYGLYIYACPVQQALVMVGITSFWAGFAAVLPFAAASWFLVERPALGLKPGSAPRRRG